MREYFLPILMLVLVACDSDDGGDRNPFLIDIGFQFEVNTNLPQFSMLNFPGSSVTIPSAGIRGVVLYNLGNDQLFAYELADPNHAVATCSTMSIAGITATCPCTDDANEYNIITGQPTQGDGRFAMKAYRVSRSNNIILITN